MATPLTYTQWLNFKANNSPAGSWDNTQSSLLKGIVNDSGMFTAPMGTEVRGSDDEIYVVAPNNGAGLGYNNDALLSRYQAYTEDPELLAQASQESEGYIKAPSTGGGTAPVLNTAAINNTQRSLDELPSILAAALERNRGEFDQAQQGFNAQEEQQRGQYDKGTVTNQQNYDANLMASIRAGIKGLGGLMSMLRGSRGTAQDEARRVVGDVTSDDIRTGADTQKENQGALDSSFSSFLTGIKEKRGRNEQAFRDNEGVVRRENATQAQDLYQKMAELYASGGDNTRAAEFLSRAGEQTPIISQYSTTPLARFDTTPVNVTAPELTAFRGATQPEIVNPAGERGQIGAGIFTLSNARKRLAGQAV